MAPVRSIEDHPPLTRPGPDIADPRGAACLDGCDRGSQFRTSGPGTVVGGANNGRGELLHGGHDHSTGPRASTAMEPPTTVPTNPARPAHWTRGAMRWVSNHNPFYVVSAVLVLAGLRMSF